MNNLVERIEINNGRLTTDSRSIAEVFGMRHDNVIRKIETSMNQLKSELPEFNRLNFEVVEYIDEKGELRKMYRLTEAGFSFAALGFSGEKAAIFRAKYIIAFETMTERLLQAPRDPLYHFLGNADAARQLAGLMQSLTSGNMLAIPEDNFDFLVRQFKDLHERINELVTSFEQPISTVIAELEKIKRGEVQVPRIAS